MSVNLHANEPNIWESPPMRIGKHDWIVAVFEHAIYGRCTRYCFCGPKVPGWYADGVYLPDQDWPTYDGNHSDGGMPRTLCRLWKRHETEIGSLLAHENVSAAICIYGVSP